MFKPFFFQIKHFDQFQEYISFEVINDSLINSRNSVNQILEGLLKISEESFLKKKCFEKGKGKSKVLVKMDLFS